MEGQILAYDENTRKGLIKGEDSNRYDFTIMEWKAQGEPSLGMKVDFEFSENNATDIYPLLDLSQITSDSSVDQNQDTGSVINKTYPSVFAYFTHPIKIDYANFDGRVTRKEYWMFSLFYWLILLVASFLLGFAGALDGGDSSPFAMIGLVVLGIYILALIIPVLSVTVRRLHDAGLSGWWALLSFIPIVNYVGGIVVLIMTLLPSQGENKFGPSRQLS